MNGKAIKTSPKSLTSDIFSYASFVSFFKIYLLIFRERRREGEREREKHQCLSRIPCGGFGLQPRHVPWLGIELGTLWFSGWCSVHRATPAGAHLFPFIHHVPYIQHRRWSQILSKARAHDPLHLPWTTRGGSLKASASAWSEIFPCFFCNSRELNRIVITPC